MMKRNFQASLQFLPLCLLLLGSLGCSVLQSVESNKVPQNEIRQNYSVRASRGGTNVSANFTRGGWGAAVDLDPPSKVENNGAEMNQRNSLIFAGVYYGVDFSYVEKTHKFVYTNNDGKKFVNELSFEPVELADGAVTISRSGDTRVALSRKIGDDESVHIVVKSSQTPPSSNANEKKNSNDPDYDVSLNNELDSTRAAIILKPKDFKRFVNGRATLKVEVSRNLDLQQGTPAGGTMIWTYESTRDANVVN